MLGKLLRHEFKQTGKLLVPVFAGLLILVLVTCILSACGGMQAEWSSSQSTVTAVHSGEADGATSVLINGRPATGGSFLSIVTGIVLFITVLYMVAFVMGVIIVCVMRFYKNLLGDEGYLLFTLPVSATQHIIAKLTVAVTWTLGAVAAAVASAFGIALSTAFRVPALREEFFSELAQMGERTGGMAGWLIAVIIGLLIMGIAMMYATLYCAMAIGSQWMQSRLLASIGAYIGLTTALQTLAVFGAFFLGMIFQDRLVAWAESIVQAGVDVTATLRMMMTNMGLVCVALAVVSTVLLAVTRYFLTKRLNLA